MIPALLLTLACALPVLAAWRIGNRAIDAHVYEFRRTPKACEELADARAAQQHLGGCSCGVGEPANDNANTRSRRGDRRAA